MRKQAQARAFPQSLSDLGEVSKWRIRSIARSWDRYLGMGKTKRRQLLIKAKTCPDMADWLRKMRLIWGEMMSAFRDPGKQPVTL